MSVEFPDGSLEMSPIFGASEFGPDGAPVYGDGDLPTVFHEFSHGYVNPLVRKDFASVIPAAKRLMKKLKPVFAANAYGLDTAVIYETFVRAAESYLVRQHLSADLAARNIVAQRSAGFLWTSDLADELAEYGKNRAKYRTFAEFLPQLEKKFLELSQNPEAIYARCPKVTQCNFVWGTKEPDSQTVTVKVSFDKPMQTDSRGVSIQPEGWIVAKKTEFAADALSFEITLKLKRGVSYNLAVNRFGRGLVSQSGYPAMPYFRKLRAD